MVADVDCLIHTLHEAAAVVAAVKDNSFDLPDLVAAAASDAYSVVHPLSQPMANPHHLYSQRSHLDT